MLAGALPFADLDVAGVLSFTADGGRPDLDALDAAVPLPLRILISLCWHENQNDRPTAAALIDRLEKAECSIRTAAAVTEVATAGTADAVPTSESATTAGAGAAFSEERGLRRRHQRSQASHPATEPRARQYSSCCNAIVVFIVFIAVIITAFSVLYKLWHMV